jgi:hypothetical protein
MSERSSAQSVRRKAGVCARRRQSTELGNVDRCIEGTVDQILPVRGDLDVVETNIGNV